MWCKTSNLIFFGVRKTLHLKLTKESPSGGGWGGRAGRMNVREAEDLRVFLGEVRTDTRGTQETDSKPRPVSYLQDPYGPTKL